MRVYDLEQGRSVERLDGHARIKPLPTELFIPGQRLFTPRYRPFIPSSTNLPPALMLRFDRPLERPWARPLDTFGTPRDEAGCHSVRGEDVKRLNDLERENGTLKRFLADAESEKVALKEIANGNTQARPPAGSRGSPAARAGG